MRMRAARTRRALTWLLVLVLVAGAAGVGWWAAQATLSPRVDESAAEGSGPEVVWASAQQGSVGRSLPLSTTLRQPARVIAVNSIPGVVRSVNPGEVHQGEVVYLVAGTPVRVVQAEEPFWRDLAKDTFGTDVTALQQFLIDGGYLGGFADGSFGPVTEAAVERWQQAQGREQTGRVPLGELIAVRELPTVVTLGENIAVGKNLGGGEDAVLAPTGEREFVLVVTEDQARLIPAEATVEIGYEEHTWEAVIAGSSQDEFGSVEFELRAPDGEEVCGDDCGVLPGDAQVTLRSQVVIVPRLEGIGVPAAAVRTRADATAYVVTESGGQDVTVLGSGQGIAIVEGIEEGTRVQVIGGDTGGGGMAPVPPPEQEQPPAEDGGDGSDDAAEG